MTILRRSPVWDENKSLLAENERLRAALLSTWNEALELAAGIVVDCGHISADLAKQRILSHIRQES